MKKLIYGTIILASIGIGIFACTKTDENKNNVLSNSMVKNQAIMNETGFQFPEGTIFTENLNSEGNVESYGFKLPSTSILHGIGSNDQIINYASGGTGTLTCTCTGNGGCKPFAAGGKWGCLMDGCSNCKGTVSSKSQSLSLFFIQRGIANEFLVLSSLATGSPILDLQEWINLPFIENSDFDNPDFIEVFNELSDIIGLNNNDGSAIVSIPFKINGKKMLIDLPYSLIEDGMLYTVQAGGALSTISCSGSCESGTCVKKYAGLGQVTYCDGCNSGCSLSM